MHDPRGELVKIRFKGDFAALRRWEEKLERVPSAMVTLNEQLAEETIELIREGFETSSNPYGRPWAQLVLRAGRPLEDTGRLKASWHRSAVGKHGFRVASGVAYAIHHQHGTGLYGRSRKPITPKRGRALRLRNGMLLASVRGTPARKMVPDSGALPTRWRDRYVETANEVLTELFR